MNRFRASLLLIVLGILSSQPILVWAKEMISVDFSKDLGVTAIGKGGVKDSEGWRPSRDMAESDEYLVLPVTPGGNFSVQKGTIEIVLKRNKIGGSAYGHNTILSFVDNTNYSPLSVYLVLEGNEGYLLVNSPGATEDHWGRRIPLTGSVEVGKTLQFAFTWGPNPVKENALFYNGRKILPRDGKTSAPLAPLLKGVDRIVFGGDFGAGTFFPRAGSTASEIKFMKAVLSDEVKTDFFKPSIQSMQDDSFKIPGISGKLVAGDKVTATLVAAPGGKASFDMGNVKGIPMEPVPATPGGPGIPAVDNGTYRATYTIKPGDDYENGRIVGNFVSSDNVAAEPVTSVSKWTIETKPRVTFSIDKTDMPADSATKARIKLVAKDANGNAVQGRRLKLTLATTDEYTGLVGAGDFGKDVGATVETRWRGETDSWGEVEFNYTAGFAAKTAILTAKDLDSGGVAVDYITAYKEASIDIALTPPVSRAASRRGLQYILKVEATRTELTADGRSRSVIRATLLDPNGVAVVNDPVTFSLSSENGTLRTIKGTTDSAGVATAEYIAGKKIGIVVITATATLRNATGSVSIILLSDAPAKIYLAARPQSLPADGFSRSDLSVKVTDINDNPNKDTKVEFKLSKGGGKLDYADRMTDKFGDAANRYTSGTTPGVATIVATVRSKVPTDAELAKARNVLFAPYSAEGDEIRVEKWLKKKGDTALRGEPIVEYTVGRSSTRYTVNAPYDCRIEFQHVEYWDRAEVGQTLAQIVPVVIPGSTSPPPPAPAPSRRRR